MADRQSNGIVLDREAEPWLGVFLGLGSVEVHADGAVSVRPEPHDDPTEVLSRARALRHGWGEPLSFVRRGFRCVPGTGVVAPGGSRCAILRGDVHDTSMVTLPLAALGWTVLGDRFVPVTFDDAGPTAHPRSAPVLVSKRRARKAGVDDVTTIRIDTDAVEVPVARADTPMPIGGVVILRIRRPAEPTVEVLTGHDRFTEASNLVLDGALAPADDEPTVERRARAAMARHLETASLPFVRLAITDSTLDDDVAELRRWWGTVDAAATP